MTCILLSAIIFLTEKASVITLRDIRNSAHPVLRSRRKTMYYIRNEDFITREIAGETILVPTGQAARTLNGMISLNETGAFLWSALRERQTPEALAERLAEQCGVDPADVQGDTAEFLERAAARGMVLRV